MFARLLEMSVKPEKKPELIRKIRDEILPILTKYKGFIQAIPLEVETEPTKFYAVSLWHEKLEAENFHTENYSKVKAIYEPFLTMPIVVKNCNVDETSLKEAKGVAA